LSLTILQCKRCANPAQYRITLITKNHSGVFCNDCKLEIEDIASLAPKPIIRVEKIEDGIQEVCAS